MQKIFGSVGETNNFSCARIFPEAYQGQLHFMSCMNLILIIGLIGKTIQEISRIFHFSYLITNLSVDSRRDNSQHIREHINKFKS